MADLKIWIANLAKSPDLTDDVMINVSNILRGYYQQCTANTDTNFVDVFPLYTRDSYSASETDLLIYIVASFSSSVLKKFDPTLNGGGDIGGNTSWKPEVGATLAASEIYLDVVKARCADLGGGLANMIFHETMHNKANLGDDVHTKGGGGLAGEKVRDSDSINDGNVSYMKAVIGNQTKQWDLGF